MQGQSVVGYRGEICEPTEEGRALEATYAETVLDSPKNIAMEVWLCL